MPEIIYWKFAHEDFPEIYESERKELDGDHWKLKCELDVPKYVTIQLCSYEQYTNQFNNIGTSNTDDSKSKLLSKSTSRRKSKKEAV